MQPNEEIRTFVDELERIRSIIRNTVVPSEMPHPGQQSEWQTLINQHVAEMDQTIEKAHLELFVEEADG